MAKSLAPQTVALDGTPLATGHGGIRRYVAELYRALVQEFPDRRFLTMTDQDNRARGWLARRWWLAGVQQEMRRVGADLFHGGDFTVPYVPSRPSVMTVHDLSPWRFPNASARVRVRTPALLRLGLATMVITPTEAVRREVVDFFRIAPQRVTAVPLAAGPEFRPVKGPPAQRPYFLYVGSTESRKNLDMLKGVWRELRAAYEVDLRVTGEGEYVPEEELPSLYSGAIACLYPSLYEGFGLPVLEAMQCGTAVIAANTPAVAEVAGDAALLLPARDRHAWRQAMEAALLGGRRGEWRARGVARAAQFSWPSTAHKTFAVYEEAMRRFHA
ncbi:MAG: glycosyltransferase family 1 protein [Bryobacteraceae bacterium]|nr:glycosyltransferase family 1 protein [Bryobacteraceae bacterium]